MMGFRQKLPILLLALAVLLVACSQVAQPAPVSDDPPSVVITGPGEGQVMAPNLVLYAIASSSNRIVLVTYSLDGGPARSVTPQSLIEIPLQNLSDGPHEIRLTVRDERGLETTVTRTFIVDSAAVPDVDFSAGFDPTSLGFTITAAGEVIWVQHTVTFTNKAGALPVFIEGYTIEFRDGNGNPLIANGSVLYGRGSLSVYLPASPQPVVLHNFVNLPAAVIFLILDQVEAGLFPDVGMHAHIYFNGTDVFGSEFVQGPFEVAIVLPASE
jgi:hypothetical protein